MFYCLKSVYLVAGLKTYYICENHREIFMKQNKELKRSRSCRIPNEISAHALSNGSTEKWMV